MAEVLTFNGVRYRHDLALDDLVAPPYDVLTAAQAAELRARSPYNAVIIDLPVPPGEAPTPNAYRRAAAAFDEWREQGVLVRDEEPGILVVEQTYTGPDGRERTRRGFVARLRLAGLGEGVVRPHERTHAGPKVDRLELYRAAHADLSQIFLLYPDDDGSAARVLDAAFAAAPAAAWREARDDDGNRHRCAPVAGAVAERAAAALRDRAVYIADGHHRYETALAYRDERRARGDHSADTVMVYLCSLADPGLTVFPTHRLVHDVPALGQERLRELIAPFFDLVGAPVTGAASCRAALQALPRHDDASAVFGLYLPDEDACLTVRAREPEASRRLAAGGFSAAAAGLSVTLLHELLFREALGLDHEDAERHIDYAKSVPDALAALGTGRYRLGAFLNPTLVEQVRAVADEGEVMPQKSTYFYPKLLTGLVYDVLG